MKIDNNQIILPLAISFFTFQQIAFITSIYKSEIKSFKFIKYFLFISFFPQLIAGPIVKFKEFYPQISKNAKNTFSKDLIIIGLFVFSIGMLKKTIISSYLASIADPIFDNFNHGIQVSLTDSWIALIAFSLQIYFDFSGYSDMAIGLALCFGIYLPINFFSPYKATSIKDFWSKWHITLSRFLKEHIYIPLGGNRKSNFNSINNVLITMLLGGIWHGASWNFLFWGIYHGLLISIERSINFIPNSKNLILNKPFKKFIVFFLITLGWILFRCADLSSSLSMIQSLFFLSTKQSNSINLDIFNVLAIGLILFITFLLPNSSEIQSFLEKKCFNKKNQFMIKLLLALLIITILIILSSPTQNINREFIYFQF